MSPPPWLDILTLVCNRPDPFISFSPAVQIIEVCCITKSPPPRLKCRVRPISFPSSDWSLNSYQCSNCVFRNRLANPHCFVTTCNYSDWFSFVSGMCDVTANCFNSSASGRHGNWSRERRIPASFVFFICDCREWYWDLWIIIILCYLILFNLMRSFVACTIGQTNGCSERRLIEHWLPRVIST
jgi:hypothetical protein